MDEAAALKVAIDILHAPSRVRHVRSRPLPVGMLILLQVAAGEEEAVERAAKLTGRSAELVQGAAIFFVEQILFSHDLDSYRVLGATPETTSAELRRNMALLLKWLHPDVQRQGERSIFAGRVAIAWDDLKTADRRAAYDEELISWAIESERPRKSRRKSGQSRRRRMKGYWQNRFLGKVLRVLFGRGKS